MIQSRARVVLCAAFLLVGGTALAQNASNNFVRLACPVNAATVQGTFIDVQVYLANSVPLGGFSLGFSYSSDMIEIDSVIAGPGLTIPGGFGSFLPRKNTADNSVLVGWLSFTPSFPMPVHTPGVDEALISTLRFKIQPGATNNCIDLDSAFIPPAGYWLLSPVNSSDIISAVGYQDCGTSDIVLGSGCTDLNSPPIAVCQPVSIAAGAGCSTSANINNGSFDPDIGDTLTLLQLPSGPYPLGVTRVILIATDSHGLSDTCESNVTVYDQTDPILNCPFSSISVPNTVGACGRNVDFTSTATDDCDGSVSISYSVSPNSFFPVGQTIVTVTATDDAGNQSECEILVEVRDSQFPVALCPDDVYVTALPGQSSATASFLLPAPSDNCPGATSIAVPPSGSIFPLGQTSVDVTASDQYGNVNHCQFNVIVSQSDIAPVVTDVSGQAVSEPNVFTQIDLDTCVSDADHSDNQLTWTATRQSGSTAITAVVNPSTHVATISYTGDQPGGNISASFRFTATDPLGASDFDDATFQVNWVNDAPVTTDVQGQTITEPGLFTQISLDTCVTDADHSDNQLTWTATRQHGNHGGNQSFNSCSNDQLHR